MNRKMGTVVLAVSALGWVGAHAQSAKPDDSQIAHIAYTASEIDIKAAQLALKRSQNREVREFAQDMVRDHKAVNEKALALVKKLKVTPQDTPAPHAGDTVEWMNNDFLAHTATGRKREWDLFMAPKKSVQVTLTGPGEIDYPVFTRTWSVICRLHHPDEWFRQIGGKRRTPAREARFKQKGVRDRPAGAED